MTGMAELARGKAQLFGTSVFGFWNISKALGACAGTYATSMTEVCGASWSPAHRARAQQLSGGYAIPK